jgi:N-acetylglucosaminyldiphosphoundecaprenol N-acetyl-beta-D-mannosaminyltransferase
MGEQAPTPMLGMRISGLSVADAADRIQDYVASGRPHYVCFSNVHSVVLGQRDEEFRRIINEADLALPDGMPVVWAGRLLGHRMRERVDGPGMMLELCRRSPPLGHSHFFYGGAEGVAPRVAERLKGRFPGLNVAGCLTPPFRPLTPEEDAEVVSTINASGAGVVWVGLGAPKQERWMAAHLGQLRAPVMLGVGAAFDFHAGRLKRAPRLMQRLGLEWLFRLAVEPRRLWRRYLHTNSAFLLAVAKELLVRRQGAGTGQLS